MSETVMTDSKNAWIYAILLWFFGGIGLHKFYINKTGMGILYLFTLGILGVGVIIDNILLAFFKVKDKRGTVLTGALSLKVVSIILILLPITLWVLAIIWVLSQAILP